MSGTRLRVLAVACAFALVGCGDEGGDAPSAASSAPSPAPSASPTPSPSASRSAAAEPSASPEGTADEGGVVLGGADLGVTRVGAPMDEAVRAVTAELGQADEDPASLVSCIASEREVRWGELVLAERDGRLAGWSSRSSTISTPSGVRRGTSLQTLEDVYGAGYTRSPANPDNPPTFSVDGVDVSGELSSAEDDAVVTRLFTSFCSGP